VAFLFRHDYGVYLGFGSCVTFVAAGLANRASLKWASVLREALAYAAAVMVTLSPLVAVVQANEGIIEYTQMRLALNQPARVFPYSSLLHMNPVRELMPVALPPPKPGVVRFEWQSGVTEDIQHQLERRYRLRRLEGRDGNDRLQYEIENLYDVNLLGLDPYITDGAGFEWDKLYEARSRLPSRENAVEWIAQVALLVPLLLVATGGLELLGAWRRSAVVPPDAWYMITAGIFLAFVDASLFREWSYVTVVVPVTAALSARFIVARSVIARGCAVSILLLTAFAAVVWARGTPLFHPSSLVASTSGALEQLFASPPVDGSPQYPYRYLHDCTVPGDRLLVTGVTPVQVSYYTERPIAGGHLAWHQGWRSDPIHEAQSLALLKHQSVPFAVSTHDPVLEDLRQYPKISEYIKRYYVELPKSRGTILVDTRRPPTGRFGPLDYPCFR
jgi:hypothetical protein